MILAIDELTGKALDFAYEKARAYARGWKQRHRGDAWTWPIEDGVMVAGHTVYGRPLPYARRHGLSEHVMRAHVRKEVGELVVVPTDLCSPKYREYQHVTGEHTQAPTGTPLSRRDGEAAEVAKAQA